MLSRQQLHGALALVIAAGCTSSAPRGHLAVAVTVDWEGSEISPESRAALDLVHRRLGGPITHFVSAAYATKPDAEVSLADAFAGRVAPGDAVAVHLHGWQSLARAAGVEPRTSPSFFTGVPAEDTGDDDAGFDLDLDAYDVDELRALVRTSRRLLEQAGVQVVPAFRAGGYLGTPKVLEAARAEGLTLDSSAIDPAILASDVPGELPSRLHELWPMVSPTSAPYPIDTDVGSLLELPIAAVADFSSAGSIDAVFAAARAALHDHPDRDVIVTVAFHLETAASYAPRLIDAIDRARVASPRDLQLVTIDRAAVLARGAP